MKVPIELMKTGAINFGLAFVPRNRLPAVDRKLLGPIP